ncbi:uncharacterized protein LOC128552573 [Mercenaria mercenaria]|uniref:uncharacterized protein LOC128552573 n=1 Tax=Mercenaria mercenaria TaxID=6596 RepID=UPI00234F3D15|nr:uncharacterized protein LOC128552573 [Mercenaria mercenaria]
MKIPIVTRDMEGWNVTYRCLEDSGEVLELNKTLRVIYMIALIKNQLIEEGSAVFFQVHPSRQTTTNLTLNHVWLFDGYNLTQTSRYQFLEQEDKIWIPFVSRDMDGKNVTYRSIESNGVINEINSTVRVSYGPNWPVYLTPNRRTYQKREGDIVPEITCKMDCSPPCNLSWGIHSRDNILKLKQITKETEGEYTCTARRVGTDNTVNETIYVYVQEETSSLFTVPIAVLAGIQALSMLFICFLLVSVLRSKTARLWKLCCQTCQSKEKSRQTDGSPGDKSLSNECQMSPLSNEAYEDLQTETRDGTMENYNNVELCEVYVNTTVDAHGHL